MNQQRDHQCRSEHLDAVISLAVEVAKLKGRVDTCEQVQIGLSADAETLEDLADAIDRADEKLSRISFAPDGLPFVKSEESAIRDIDDLLWPTFDKDTRLQWAGGWCVLENVLEDLYENSNRSDQQRLSNLDFEDVSKSADRWCSWKTAWFRNRRYWIDTVGGWVIIKRNMFLFQARLP